MQEPPAQTFEFWAGRLTEKVDGLVTDVKELTVGTNELAQKVTTVCAQEAARENLCAEHRARIEGLEVRYTEKVSNQSNQRFQRQALLTKLLIYSLIALVGAGVTAAATLLA